MSHHRVEAKDLHFTYPDGTQALAGVSFCITHGQSVAVVGANGAGKSTLLMHLCGVHLASRGDVRIGDAPVTPSTLPLIRRSVGMVFQDPMASLNPTMTVGAQLSEGLIYHGIASKKEARMLALELLREVEIQRPEERLNQYPHELSGGMRQRVLIAIALAAKPRLLIADEPTTALDVTVQSQILELLKRRNPLTGLLLITHDLAVVAEMCEKVLVFYAGKIVEQGTVSQILSLPRHPYTQMLLRSIPRLDRPRTELLEAIAGAPPNLLSPPKGCPFAERCPYVMPICQREPPFIGTAACWKAPL